MAEQTFYSKVVTICYYRRLEAADPLARMASLIQSLGSEKLYHPLASSSIFTLALSMCLLLF